GVVDGSITRTAPGGAFQSAQASWWGTGTIQQTAGFYRQALAGTGDAPDWELETKLAGALANAGQTGEAGDRYLVAAAGCLRRALRDSDVAGRWGGDEFLALLPETGPDGAEEAARRVVAEGLATEVELDGADGHSVQLPVRFSAGWAEAAPGADPDAAVRAADASLYRAKAVGDGADQAGPPPTVPTGPGLPGPTRQ
ncbi:MAG: GGDEF domain-containing protein, partial [Actinomycetota bacterium]|nr:GGDEF domain-containing protein [Actinomycetota bacterium]